MAKRDGSGRSPDSGTHGGAHFKSPLAFVSPIVCTLATELNLGNDTLQTKALRCQQYLLLVALLRLGLGVLGHGLRSMGGIR